MTKAVFQMDSLIGMLSGALGILWPRMILGLFATGPYPSLALEMTRWFCMFLFAFAYMQRLAPQYGLEAVRLFHRAAFVADLIYPFVFFSLMRRGGSFGLLSMVVILYHF